MMSEFQNKMDVMGEERGLSQEGFVTAKQNHTEMPELRNMISKIKK